MKQQTQDNQHNQLDDYLQTLSLHRMQQVNNAFRQTDTRKLHNYFFLKTCYNNIVLTAIGKLKNSSEQKRKNIFIPEEFYNININKSLLNY